MENEGCRAVAEGEGGRLASVEPASYGSASQPKKEEMTFFYVYILESEVAKETFYVGFTGDLQLRLKIHNSGQVPHTAKFRPWRIKTAISFTDYR